MQRFGVSLGDIANGVGLGRVPHRFLHTERYYEEVNRDCRTRAWVFTWAAPPSGPMQRL